MYDTIVLVMIVAIIIYVVAFLLALVSFVWKKLSLVSSICAIAAMLAGGLYCYFMQYDLVYSILGFGGIALFLLIYLVIRGGKREL